VLVTDFSAIFVIVECLGFRLCLVMGIYLLLYLYYFLAVFNRISVILLNEQYLDLLASETLRLQAAARTQTFPEYMA
jgi:hypothetical protein